MAYENPYIHPESNDNADLTHNVVPPEATAAKTKIGLSLGVTAGVLVLTGLLIGLTIGKSDN